MQVTKDIFDELTFDPSLDASDISVGTKNGVVTMTGMVRTYAEKIAAEHAVKRVFGVRGLAEELQVDIPKLHQRTNAEIVAAALNILKWDASLPRDTVTVKVEDKWLTLDGAVPWEFQREHARHMVSSLIGVRGVTNQITVPTRPVNERASALIALSLFLIPILRRVRQIVERTFARRLVHLEIVEKVIHDLAVVEADLGELTAADRDDLMHVPLHARVLVIYGGVVGVVGFGARNDFRSAQGRLVAVRAHRVPPSNR